MSPKVTLLNIGKAFINSYITLKIKSDVIGEGIHITYSIRREKFRNKILSIVYLSLLLLEAD